MIEMQCKCCGEWKPEECFEREVAMTNGRRNKCRVCRAAQKRAWTRAQPKKLTTPGPVRRIMASPECNALADNWRYTVTTGPLVPTLGWIVPELGRAA
jgi:hypothetical protein